LTAPSAHAQNVVAKCAGAVRNVSKTLNVSPKFANPKNMNRTCAINSARPVLSSAELLRRYVGVANIAKKKAPPKVIKACPGMVRKAVMASGAGSKAASAGKRQNGPAPMPGAAPSSPRQVICHG
jgi:hypothetical protein